MSTAEKMDMVEIKSYAFHGYFISFLDFPAYCFDFMFYVLIKQRFSILYRKYDVIVNIICTVITFLYHTSVWYLENLRFSNFPYKVSLQQADRELRVKDSVKRDGKRIGHR